MNDSIQDFINESKHNVIMFSANFLQTDFRRLSEEYDEKGYVAWEIKGKGNQDIKAGDICYIYYTNLPSTIGYDQSRVLLRAIVKDKPREMTREEIYGSRVEDIQEKTIEDLQPTFPISVQAPKLPIGFTIEDLQPIELKDYNKYSWHSLKTKYNFESAPRSTMKLKNMHNQLYKDIESNFKSSKKGFEELIKYFNTPCFFEKYLHKNNPLTFRKRNGLFYYEKHHFVQQYTGKRDKDNFFNQIIDEPENIINLCPLCHKKIHHGTPEEVLDMVEMIYKDKETFLKLKNMGELINNKDILEWIKESYKANIILEGKSKMKVKYDAKDRL